MAFHVSLDGDSFKKFQAQFCKINRSSVHKYFDGEVLNYLKNPGFHDLSFSNMT